MNSKQAKEQLWEIEKQLQVSHVLGVKEHARLCVQYEQAKANYRAAVVAEEEEMMKPDQPVESA